MLIYILMSCQPSKAIKKRAEKKDDKNLLSSKPLNKRYSKETIESKWGIGEIESDSSVDSTYISQDTDVFDEIEMKDITSIPGEEPIEGADTSDTAETEDITSTVTSNPISREPIASEASNKVQSRSSNLARDLMNKKITKIRNSLPSDTKIIVKLNLSEEEMLIDFSKKIELKNEVAIIPEKKDNQLHLTFMPGAFLKVLKSKKFKEILLKMTSQTIDLNPDEAEAKIKEIIREVISGKINTTKIFHLLARKFTRDIIYNK